MTDRRTLLGAAALLLAASRASYAQSPPASPSPSAASPSPSAGTPTDVPVGYPDRPIRVIVPYAAGGGGDTVFRMITEPLGATLGKALFMEHRAGAGGTIGLEALARAAGDGYTIGVGSSDAVALAPNFYPKLGYDPIRDLQPIAIVADMPLVLIVRTESPLRSLDDLIADAKARPGRVTYGTPGRGSSPHLMGELLARGAGVELQHIPYRGTAPAIADLFGGHVDAVITSGFDAVPLERARRIRALAVTGQERYRLLPETPTLAQHRITGLEDLRVWFGLFAPAAAPRPIVARLAAEIDTIVATDDYRRRAADLGFVPIRSAPEKIAAQIRQDVVMTAERVRKTGVRPD